uniref:RNA helicase n=1 Tax=Scophthalmus maximus TaxID=52904 RepID=A0A8D3CYH4_SCOMX
MPLSQLSEIGLDFFEFLKETNRLSITDRFQLKDVYNSEFRSRTVLFVHTCHSSRFCPDPLQVRALYVDQWPTPGTRRPQATAGRATGPGPLSTTTSPDEAETGVRARRKLASLLMGRLKTDRAQFISDKSGVSITSDPQFVNGKLSLCVEGTYEYSVNLNVTNTGTEPVYFTYYSPLTRLRYLSLTDEHNVTKSNPLTLRPGDSCDVQLHFHCSWVGIYPATLAFEFTPDLQTSSAAFHIVRFIEAQCITSLGLELAPVAPFRPRSLPAWTPTATSTIVDGQRPEGMSLMQLKNVLDLKKYAIPPYVNQLVNALKSSLPHNRRALLQSPLSWENYAEKFQLLLFLEELQMVVDMKRYNIPNDDKEEHAVMTRDAKNKKLLVLEVPGVAENRPSVLRGDELLVRPAGETGVKYRGYVHSVELNRVKLGFSSELLSRFYEGMKFSVEFTVNRLTLRLQHRAAELVEEHGLEELLFPAAPSSSAQQPELPNLRSENHQLLREINEEQFRAVKHIVAGSSRPAPYLVFGPPGTGKTVTLVEAIKQIEKTQASCRILACAPSNSAADLLCKKILDHVDDFKVFRMYASSRDPKMVPEELKRYTFDACSNLVGDCYLYPPKEKLMEYRVVVTTLLTAGRLVSGGVPTGHYTHVFVDEAGHAVETECLVPLAGLLHVQTGQVVLAGDPEQLGPIIRSPFCQKYGLGVSLLQRLMKKFSLYQKDEGEFNSRFVTKLLCNYRSHPAILKIPNELFYDKELQCHADEILRNSYCSWAHLPQIGFPLIFHGVTGVDERESSSPSFFNRAEVEVLMDYVKKLLQTHGKKGLATIAPRDIGIIAPYRKQVGRHAHASNLEKCRHTWIQICSRVGSVEEFQGQERRVILVSTVRSSSSYMDFDTQFQLGFVKNKKRFNVAVTRAKALLIVVGNPRVLNTDATWARWVSHGPLCFLLRPDMYSTCTVHVQYMYSTCTVHVQYMYCT